MCFGKFHSAMKHKNDILSDMIDCLQAVRIFPFMKD